MSALWKSDEQGSSELIVAECDTRIYLADVPFIAQLLFSNGEKGGYWSVDPNYLFEDSSGTIPASVGGLVGRCVNAVYTQPNATTANDQNKPRLNRTPRTRKYWFDSITAGYELVAVFDAVLGDCTIVTVGIDGVLIESEVPVDNYYSLFKDVAYSGGILIINRELTGAETELVRRHFDMNKPGYGNQQNAIPQLSGYIPNTEREPYWAGLTNLSNFWNNKGRYIEEFNYIDTSNVVDFTSTWNGCIAIVDFPSIDTSNGVIFNSTWRGLSSLSSFPLIDTSKGTDFVATWNGCVLIYEFPLLDVSGGTNFSYTWCNCRSLEYFPLLDVSNGTNFNSTWCFCYALVHFPLLNTSKGVNFYSSWNGCTSLIDFPLLDVSSGTKFSNAWGGCTVLADFPAGMFDNWIGIPVSDCFLGAWYDCGALTETSISRIVVSIAASGQSAPATGTEITLDGVASLETIQANSTIMAAITVLKARNWTPTYKGTEL